MTFWSGEKLIDNHDVIRPFERERVDVNSYNLRVGRGYYCSPDGSGEGGKINNALADGETFRIPSGQFAFLLTLEEVAVPHDAMAFISMRTGKKFGGLINVSGFHVDPGYRGNLVFAVFNAGSGTIHVAQGEPFFKIWFADMDRKSSKPYVYTGKGLSQIDPSLAQQMSREIYSLQGLAEKIRDIETKLDSQKPTIENLNFVIRSLVVGLTAGIIVAAFRLTS
ncbi:dCTP deaminase domain-containing protein [Salinarimonas chemoclinalis]|uniref:dCTP deaminase domain-containing protein n=1 Tax=Salinarimonas chemoclinalis TaxID=3241599 RepID=UPI003557C319